MKYLALALLTLTSTFTTPTTASATEPPAQGLLVSSSNDPEAIRCEQGISRLFPWCWKA
ncbi:hypothetical protein ACN082_00735 [Rothia sp. CCM 9417]|uniref:hypothetical protein n=1 Tax=Rothia sp. CCM 9417 TaxID=3402657 RepID=UPI003ADA582D